MTVRVGAPTEDLDHAITLVTDRVADRLIEAIEHDDARSSSKTVGVALAGDERRQQLLVGAWISDEVTSVNEARLQRGRARCRSTRNTTFGRGWSPNSPEPAHSSRT